MINDPNKNARLKRLCDALAISGTAVNGEQQLYAIFHRGGECPLWYAMPIRIAVRNVAFGNRPNRAKRANHNCSPSEAICVKVANNEHWFALSASCAKSSDQPSSIRKERRLV